MFGKSFFKIAKLTVASLMLLVIFLAASSFSLGRHIGGQKVNCPFAPGQSSICKMTPGEHIQAWQNMFATLPGDDSVLLFCTLLLLLGILGSGFLSKRTLNIWSQSIQYFNPFYFRKTFISDPFQEAFSRGIINPKLF